LKRHFETKLKEVNALFLFKEWSWSDKEVGWRFWKNTDLNF